MAIARDSNGIICQVQEDGTLDGGDSACRTGIMAMCGSEQDIDNLRKFVKPKSWNDESKYLICRNPGGFSNSEQDETDPANTSRDQAVAFFGLKSTRTTYYAAAAVDYSEGWFINKDFLDPSIRLYLRTTYYPIETSPLWMRVFGYAFLFAALIFNTKIKPHEEMNQFVCVCNRFGPWWLKKLRDWHPDLYGNIREYWGGWRQQEEIGEALISHIEKRIGEL